jgi:hypothetical protein
MRRDYGREQLRMLDLDLRLGCSAGERIDMRIGARV